MQQEAFAPENSKGSLSVEGLPDYFYIYIVKVIFSKDHFLALAVLAAGNTVMNKPN